MTGKVAAEIWLDVRPFNGGPGTGPGPIAGGTSSDAGFFGSVQQALNQGVIIDQLNGGITFFGPGSIKGGKTSYDVGSGFWLGGDGDTALYYKVAIGDPDGDTFNWDGQEINAKMNNLDLRGSLRGPADFVIDPATHGDNTGEVTIAGNLEVAGGSIRGPSTLTIDPAAVGDNTGLVVIAGSLQVDGITTTVNSTEMTVDDINIVLANGAANAAAANGGGITLEGANATLLYTSSDDEWNFNKGLNVTGDIDSTANITAVGGLTGATLDIGGSDFTVNANGDLVTAGSISVALTSNLNGNVNLGDADTDDIVFNGLVNSSIVPDGTTHDLGTSTNKWQNLYASTVNADTVNADTVNAATLNADTLDVGGGDFSVDADGNIDANGATFASIEIDSATPGTILKQVDAQGNPMSLVAHTTMNLNNVDSATPTDATVLKYNNTNTQYESVDFKTTSLEDVSSTAASNNEVLIYDSTASEYAPAEFSLSNLTDLNIADPAAGDLLVYQESDDKWHNKTKTGAGFADIATSGSWSDLSNTPTTIGGYGITDALQIGTTATTALAGDTAIPAEYTDSDVDTHLNTSTANTDEVLSYNGTDYAWVDAGSVSSVAFSDLTNTPTTIGGYGITDALQIGTTATTALAGDTDLFDGAFTSLSGVPGFAENLGDLGDVTISSLQDGQILKYDSTDTRWENVDNTLAGLSDTDISSPANNEVLHYDSTAQKWESQGFTIGMLTNVDSNADSPTANNVEALGASPSGLMYKQSTSEWVVTAIEIDDLYGIPDPAASSAAVGDVLAIKTLAHPQEYEWVSIDTIDGGTY